MDEVIIDRPAPWVARLSLNRPDARNALGPAMRERLAALFAELSTDVTVRCIVLTGGEKVFAAGADLKALAGQQPIDVLLAHNERFWEAIARCPKPVIAAVNGYALGGGCELAMHADLIVAGEGARFGQPEVKVGLMPGAGGTQRLVRAVGKFKALKLLFTGEPVSGREAFDLGLASEVVPDDQVQARALELAIQIASRPPLAIAQIKEVVLAGQDAPLETALMLERKAFQLLFASRDQEEGVRAFLEKRPPEFEGR